MEDSISKKITSRPGFSKVVLLIRKRLFVSRNIRSCLVIMVPIVLEMSEMGAMGR